MSKRYCHRLGVNKFKVKTYFYLFEIWEKLNYDLTLFWGSIEFDANDGTMIVLKRPRWQAMICHHPGKLQHCRERERERERCKLKKFFSLNLA